MIAALWHRLTHRDAVSLDWLRDLDRKESRIVFEGVAITWPIQKFKNEHALWNTNKLRKEKAA